MTGYPELADVAMSRFRATPRCPWETYVVDFTSAGKGAFARLTHTS